jgi:hypothetical protein
MKTCKVKEHSEHMAVIELTKEENRSLMREVEDIRAELVSNKADHTVALSNAKSELQDAKLEIACNKVRIEELTHSRQILDEIAKQPKTTTTNKTTNKVSFLTPLDLSQERINELVEANFTNAHLLEGQKGVARFTVDHVIKDIQGKLQYICTDPARNTFRYKDGESEIKDIRGKKLSNVLVPPVMDKTSRLGVQAILDNPNLIGVYIDAQMNIRGMRDDNAEFRGELASMVG